ncbi:cysteine-rich PDZ-binding protein [Eupeodes corollae]|uniref:cysteine-rich PDZ-binding protein n=1 Tax=Eupeodes corollae TaxID=290404 RepID=UPI0024933745|nr:cysteine-rich PDZ-binding protein [Eupeodes corollae]
MVCEKCEAKLSKIITPDPWKAGARNTTKPGGRKVNENKALTSAREKASPMSRSLAPCRICRQKVYQAGSHYCQSCAYKKGICAMCGKKLMDTKMYKQSSV